MATVHYSSGCRDAFDDDDSRFDRRDGLGGREGRLDEADAPLGRSGDREIPSRPKRGLHRIAEVRRQQGVTLRNVARRLGTEIGVVRRQEQDDCDLRISDVLLWQQVLEVPVAELLVEGDGQLSGPVLERSRMVKLMKTAAAIRERTGGTPVGRLVNMLVEQILEIMPELRDVTPWHTVGQRRTLEELGKIARCTVPDEMIGRSG
jgi:transcriptional regulator with XRE-family HTH domain